MSKGDLMKLFKKVWKNLTDAEKGIYENEYKRSKEIYKKKLAEFYSSHPEEKEQVA